MAENQVIQKKFVFSAPSQHLTANNSAMMKIVEQEISPGVCKHQPQSMGCEHASGVLFQHRGAEGRGNPAPVPATAFPSARLHLCLPCYRLLGGIWMKAATWRSPETSISPPSWRARCQGLPEATGIARCRGRGRRAATRCSALGIFALCLLSCYFRQAKKWLGFQETPMA